MGSAAMGAYRDPKAAQETLQYALENAREQDLIYFFRGVGANRKSRRELAAFFKGNYDQVRLSVCPPASRMALLSVWTTAVQEI